MIIMFILALLPYQKGEDGHTNTVSGTIFCQDGKGSVPLGGASISLVAGKDTLYTVSDNQGHYSFNFEQIFEVILLAKYQGFDDFRETYQIYGKRTAIAIQMKRSKQLLDAARIKSEIPFVRSDADTVIYNMAALEKMEGDRALSLLLQIPGFSIKDGRLMVWGQYVDKTYVNGKLLFGDNPMSALALLKADEVKNVRVYDTQKMEDVHRGLKHSKKRRVIDIQTFNQFLSSVDLQVQSRMGVLLEKQEPASVLRYSSGADFDSDSEMQQLSFHVNGNNVNNGQNGQEVTKGIMPALFSDYTQTDASCEYVKKWDDAEWGKSLSFDYCYDRNKDISENETVIDRIGTENGVVPLHYEQKNSSQSRYWSHSAMIGTDLHDTPLKDIGLFMKLSFDDNSSSCAQRILNDSGTSGVQRQEQKSGASSRQFCLTSQLNWSNPHAKSGWVPNVILVASTSSNPQHTYAVDTLSSSTTRRQLDGNGSGMETALFGSFSLKKSLSDSPIITPELEFISSTKYNNIHRQMMTVDYLRPDGFQTDYVNCYDFSWNNLEQTVSTCFSVSSAYSQLLSIMAGITGVWQMDVESYPSDISTDKDYFTPFLAVSIAPPFRKDKLFINYSIKGTTPALEQIRQRVDNSNPIRLRMGNPELKMPAIHTMGISYFPHISSNGSSFSLRCLLELYQNPIVDKIQYYSTGGSFNAWGVEYEIPSGGTLTGYENAGYSMHYSCGASYDCRINALKGIFKSELNFILDKSPEYDMEHLNCLTSSGPMVKLSFLTTPIKNIRLNLTSVTSYSKSINDNHSLLSENVVENVSATADIRFLKHAFCDTRYSASIYRYLNGYGIDTDIYELTFALGCFCLNGKLAVSISGSDMLGQSLKYTTKTTGTEFSRYSSASLGRYCLLNVAYRFSKRE